MSGVEKDPLLDLFVFETIDLISQLENIALSSEESQTIESEINAVFRIVHTIKGSAAMMGFENIAMLSHSLEDGFYYIRENHPEDVDYAILTDVVLESIDFIKKEISEIQSGNKPENNVDIIVHEINELIALFKKDSPPGKEGGDKAPPLQAEKESHENAGMFTYKAVIYFEYGCEMENVRAFDVIHNLEKAADIFSYTPQDINNGQSAIDAIRKNGFEIQFSTDLSIDDVRSLLSNTLFIKEIKIEIIGSDPKESSTENGAKGTENNQITIKQSMISVNISKLDVLMDLVGELVISQAMVTQNPELDGLVLNNFLKASRQLQKVTNELQDAVMSIRMVPLSATFQKMNRIVRDMGRKLDKDVKLEIIGEEIEVDKNIIEHLSDPLLHLVRNAVDHGIEPAQERAESGKPSSGKVTLEARNEGGNVRIIVRDDGKGLDRESILRKARQQGLLKRPEAELSDREIYSFIFFPGFSTNEEVTEFSGRGVGMDVVNKNIEDVGGIIQVDSTQGAGTAISIRIPLTLTIIDGMKLRVGKAVYVIPIASIKESFRVKESAVIRDETNNSEMMIIRGECCPVVRLHEFFKIQSEVKKLEEGIIVLVENESRQICLFADELIGEQQVVVKALPEYIKSVQGISGCTVMGDGSVSLIIDVTELINCT